jgi:hypothetical protein
VVTAHDPVAIKNAARIRPDLRYAGSISEAAADADVVLHLTEWADYRALDPVMLATVVARRNIIDARCTLDEKPWLSAGWSFRPRAATRVAAPSAKGSRTRLHIASSASGKSSHSQWGGSLRVPGRR